MTPFLRRPVRPAARSETHFLALPLKVALQAHKQEAALFHVPPLHAAHVKDARQEGVHESAGRERDAESFHCVAFPVITPETKQRDASVLPQRAFTIKRRSFVVNEAIKRRGASF